MAKRSCCRLPRFRGVVEVALPAQISGIEPRHATFGVERNEVQPAIVEQGAISRVTFQDVGYSLTRGFDPHRGRSGSCTSCSPSWIDCHGSSVRKRSPLPSTTPMPPVTLWSSLLPASAHSGRNSAQLSARRATSRQKNDGGNSAASSAFSAACQPPRSSTIQGSNPTASAHASFSSEDSRRLARKPPRSQPLAQMPMTVTA